MGYEVEITPEGLRHLNQLPEKGRGAALELIFGTLSEEPRRVGKPLVGELYGLWSARRGTASSTRSTRKPRSCSSTASSIAATCVGPAEPGLTADYSGATTSTLIRSGSSKNTDHSDGAPIASAGRSS